MFMKPIVTEPDAGVASPTISGAGGLELTARAIEAVRAALRDAGGVYRTTRKDFALREGFSGLDRHRLRDLGIDRSRA